MCRLSPAAPLRPPLSAPTLSAVYRQARRVADSSFSAPPSPAAPLQPPVCPVRVSPCNRRSAPCAATADRGGRGDYHLQHKMLKAPSPHLFSPRLPVTSLKSGDWTSCCRHRETSNHRIGRTPPAVATLLRRPSCTSPTGGRAQDVFLLLTPHLWTKKRWWRVVAPGAVTIATRQLQGTRRSSTSTTCCSNPIPSTGSGVSNKVSRDPISLPLVACQAFNKEIFEPGQYFWILSWKIKRAKLIANLIIYIELQMAPIKLINKRTYADFTETPRKPRFKDFDNIEYADTYSKWSIHVRVDVKFLPNKYNDNICFVLMDKTGAKIEATVWGNAEVARFNRILQLGCKYTIHRVIISPNAESVEFRAIEHLFECRFDRKTVVEPSLPIEFPILPKHLMPFSDVAKRPNKTFVDIVGIVVHCCELERFGRYGKYREAIFADAWGNLIAVGIQGLQLIQSSYLWSTAEGGNPIVIATMLQKDIKFGDLNTSDHTNIAFNPAHRAARPLQDIRQKIISGAIDMTFVQRFVERRSAFVAMVLAKRDARYRK